DQSKLHFLLPEFFFNRLPVLDVCIRSNVTVRQIEAVWSENESRAAAPSFLRHSRSVSSSARGRLLNFYIDNRRADLVRRRDDCARICVHEVFWQFRVRQIVSCRSCVLRLKPFVAQ